MSIPYYLVYALLKTHLLYSLIPDHQLPNLHLLLSLLLASLLKLQLICLNYQVVHNYCVVLLLCRKRIIHLQFTQLIKALPPKR